MAPPDLTACSKFSEPRNLPIYIYTGGHSALTESLMASLVRKRKSYMAVPAYKGSSDAGKVPVIERIQYGQQLQRER
eukprot:23646-Pelagomonas_calceolata.AAC.1